VHNGSGVDHHDHVQHQIALLARRGERIRLEALENVRSPLDRSGFLLLGHLEEQGPQTMSELATAFDLDASTVTRQVAPLERRGWVVRTPSPHDRRATIVEVTEQGRRERELVRQARISCLQRLMSDWGEDEVAELAAMLERLNATLGEGVAQYDEAR